MKSEAQNRADNKTANRRTMAAALLICFALVSLLCGALILTHADHEHDHSGVGGSCAVCAQIQSAPSILRLLGTAAFGVILLAGCLAAGARIRAVCVHTAAATPITAKTRLNQ